MKGGGTGAASGDEGYHALHGEEVLDVDRGRHAGGWVVAEFQAVIRILKACQQQLIAGCDPLRGLTG